MRTPGYRDCVIHTDVRANGFIGASQNTLDEGNKPFKWFQPQGAIHAYKAQGEPFLERASILVEVAFPSHRI